MNISSNLNIVIEKTDPKCEEHSQIHSISFIKTSYFSYFLFFFVVLLTGGLIFFLLSWFSYLKYIFFYSRCNRNDASKVMIMNSSGEYFYIDITKDEDGCILFEYNLFRYYETEFNTFNPVIFNPNTNTNKDFINKYSNGINTMRLNRKSFKYGKSNLSFEIKSFLMILFNELCDPFYLFQIGSVTLWYFNAYEKYATIIVLTSAVSLIISAYEIRKNLLKIQAISYFSIDIKVVRNNVETIIKSDQLIPGDLFYPPAEGELIPVDGCIISGSIICNEALLTGESTPVIKESLQNEKVTFNIQDIEKFMMFAGTKVIQRRGNCKAIVTSIGFSTQKGNLIRSILFPKKIKSNFQSESIKFIIFMGILGIIGYSINLYFMIENESNKLSPLKMFLKFLDLVTIVVPPALPACLAIGISLAARKLDSQGLKCIEKDRINMAGQINLISFDKTGTLTEDSLEIIGFKQNRLTSKGFTFSQIDVNTKELCLKVKRKLKKNSKKKKNHYQPEYENIFDEFNDKHLLMDRLFIESLATCHTITKIKEKLLGDPIDVEMFNKSFWKYKNEEDEMDESNIIVIQPEDNIDKTIDEESLEDEVNDHQDILRRERENMINNYNINIIRRFNFSSKLQRMSVVCKSSIDSNFYTIFTKGSPEKIRELCREETYPKNYEEIITSYTSKGYRVLGMSVKLLDINANSIMTIDRSLLESEMIFLGLIIVQNKLKPQTIPTIKILNDCKIKMVMATGDNILTAVAVSKESKLVNEGSNVYKCIIEKDLNNNEALNWELLKDNKINQDEKEIVDNLNQAFKEILVQNPKNSLNSLRRNSQKRKSYVISNTINSKIEKYSIMKKSSVLYMENHDDIKKYFNLIKVTKNNLKDENEEVNNTTEGNDGNDFGMITIKSNNNSILESNLSNESLLIKDSPFDSLKINNNFEENIIVTNGYTFHKLYTLHNEFLTTNNQELKVYAETFRILLRRGVIFARMSPEHKASLVEAYQFEGFNVLMCGDGANDCSALKVANVGVSLSQEEASIAAPFTSIKPDISCLLILFSECKSSLVTSFQCFKFMIFYSLIQYSSIILLNINNSYFNEYQFLSADLFIVFPIAILLEKTDASKILTKHLPTSSLLSFYMIFSIGINFLIFLIFQVISIVILINQSFYDMTKDVCENIDDVVTPCGKNTIVYLVGNFQYFTAFFTIVLIRKFKKPFYTNIYMMIFLVLMLGYSTFMIFKKEYLSKEIIGLIEYDNFNFNYIILGIVIGNLILCLFIEFLITRPITFKWKNRIINKRIEKITNQSEELSLNDIHQAITGVISY